MQASGLSQEELSWVGTLNIGALEAISPAAPSLASPTWVTAPSSPSLSVPSVSSAQSSPKWVTAPSSPMWPMWKGLPLTPPNKELKAKERLVRNREHAKTSRARKRAYAQAMQARAAEIERENAALRAEVERELRDNLRMKEALALDGDECVWA